MIEQITPTIARNTPIAYGADSVTIVKTVVNITIAS